MSAECIFCQIVVGTIPSQKLFEDDHILAIKDINPVAPVHHLLMPKAHIESAAQLGEADGEMLGRLFSVGASLARDEGLDESGYRLITNIGEGGGQSVPHLHFHLIGGRRLPWPPG